jgi:nicotinamide-nucleotide amidase
MNKVYASIITIGDELLIGQTIDTNSAFIAQQLNHIGILVLRRIAVGDRADEIRFALDQESGHAQVIILTGGLGPTADDITKPFLCDYFGGKLKRDPATLAHIQYLFNEVYKRPGGLVERNQKQADIPDNCTLLPNPVGTAPGMLFRKNNVIYVSLPGVPQEMKDIMTGSVVPLLQKELSTPVILHHTILTFGVGESVLAEQLINFEKNLPPSVSLAYLPQYGMVKLRLTAIGENKEVLFSIVERQVGLLKKEVAEHLAIDSNEELESYIGKLLLARNATVGTAESCTGGLIASLISAVPGASRYYEGSVISYSNEAKQKLLGVKSNTLIQFGAVSEQVVKEMAKGILTSLGCTYAIAVSGIMGPDGGTPEKPVGTVWIAVGNKEKIETKQYKWGFDRSRNTKQTALSALNLLRLFLLKDSMD